MRGMMGRYFPDWLECLESVPASDDMEREYPAPEDFDGVDDTPEPEPPTCPICGEPMEWESGDSDVGMPGYWYCPCTEDLE